MQNEFVRLKCVKHILKHLLQSSSVQSVRNTVCPGSSDLQEIFFNIFGSENEVLHHLLTLYDTLG